MKNLMIPSDLEPGRSNLDLPKRAEQSRNLPKNTRTGRAKHVRGISFCSANRSPEELAMRSALIPWGRTRWPGARVLEELSIGGCRVDLAFVQPDHVAVVEIKSSRDTLDRLDRQLKDFTDHIPEVWLATAPRWIEPLHSRDRNGHLSLLHYDVGHIIVADGVVNETVSYKHWARPHAAKVDYLLTVPLLHVAHLVELKNIAADKGLAFRERWTCRQMMRLLARNLTGDEMVSGVCRELRARPRGWPGDEPLLTPTHR